MGDSDVLPVVVLRHAGTALAFTDAIWEKYAFGERSKVKDATLRAQDVGCAFIKST